MYMQGCACPQVLQQMGDAGTRQVVEDMSIEHMITGVDSKRPGAAIARQHATATAYTLWLSNLTGLLGTPRCGLCRHAVRVHIVRSAAAVLWCALYQMVRPDSKHA